ncbi:hypothetical protein QE152_g41304 [Popillia japonica]|uniref:EB domain-containing protein n=1 Tax=Popillia japonica TaxID=7064 RepID=A0AAW1GS12_POPJA
MLASGDGIHGSLRRISPMLHVFIRLVLPKFLKKNLAATEFTDPCDELAQCSTYLSGSFCQNNTCTCNPGSQATDQLALAISGDADAHQDITTPQTVVASLRAV